jgi:FkbM family methyltransferase
VSELSADAPRPDGWSAENLRKDGLAPATMIDVGAGGGTPPLSRAFPDAYHVLIEPLREFEPKLRKRLERHDGELLTTAVGETRGDAVLNVNPELPVMSSLLRTAGDLPGAAAVLEQRRVSMTTLDALLEERAWAPPFGLKIDTEGAEDLVIKGAGKLLRETQFVIAEVWAARAFEGGYTFAEFMSLMESRGFDLRDILHVRRSRMTNELMYIDALFRPSAAAGAPSSART